LAAVAVFHAVVVAVVFHAVVVVIVRKPIIRFTA
jgi:hypothetical protein